jgi:4-amino-4-deoxy-L-arabinose transferase-like glycosyltransferase
MNLPILQGKGARNGAAALALFFVAASVRLHDLGHPSLSTDEVRWIERGDELVARLERGEFRRATVHLDHPGIPTALTAGIAHRLGLRASLDPVAALRLPFALAGALLPPFLFLASKPLWGVPAAATAAVLLALEPRHVAASRMVHLDISFSWFYLLALWAFFHSREGNRRLGLFAAVSLALAQATRTSAVLLPVTVVAFALLEALRTRRWCLEARDLLLGYLAALLFVGSFPKLWLSPAAIPEPHRYHAPATVEAFLAAVSLRPAAFLFAAAAAAVGAWVARRRLSGALALGAALFLAASVLAPDTIRNVAGFAGNILHARQRLHHYYYGVVLRPPPGKYATLLAEGMPAVSWIGALGGLACLGVIAWRDRGGRLGSASLLVIAAVGVFLGFASVLAKVAVRYLMPIYPLLALAGGVFWSRALRRLPGPAAPLAVAVAVAWAVLPASPNFGAWRSTLGRFLAARLDLPRSFTAEGHDEAALYLWRHARPEHRVSALCYDDVLRFYWTGVLPRRLREPPKPPPRIGYFPPETADFVVISARRKRIASESVRRFAAEHTPALRVEIDGETALEVFDRTAPSTP